MTDSVRPSYAEYFEHSFDEKGRITVPADWRREGYEAHLVIIPFQADFLTVYPASWLSRIMAKLDAEGVRMGDPKRKAFEKLAATSQNATWDQQGRMNVKERLRQFVGIKKEAVVSGGGDHFKIWSIDKFKAAELAEADLQQAAQVLEI